jgi:hypothetical protein
MVLVRGLGVYSGFYPIYTCSLPLVKSLAVYGPGLELQGEAGWRGGKQKTPVTFWNCLPWDSNPQTLNINIQTTTVAGDKAYVAARHF